MAKVYVHMFFVQWWLYDRKQYNYLENINRKCKVNDATEIDFNIN